MLSLLSSYHYSRSTAFDAFSFAAQFAHVTAAQLQAAIDAVCVNVEVENVGDRGSRFDLVRAVWADDVMTELDAWHGTLCSVCLCPCVEGEGRPLMGLARPFDRWLTIGRREMEVGPVHDNCRGLFNLVNGFHCLDNEPHEGWASEFHGRLKRGLSRLREDIPRTARPLRFRPTSNGAPRLYFSDLRENGSYRSDDVVAQETSLARLRRVAAARGVPA